MNGLKQQKSQMNQNSSNLSSMSFPNNIDQYRFTDEELMSRFQDGDENAYNELVSRFKNKLLSFIYRFVNDLEIAEDILQDTLMKVFTHRHYYKEIAKVSTWIYTIAGNFSKTELRKRARRKIIQLSHMSKDDKVYDIPDYNQKTDEQVQRRFSEQEIQNALQSLPIHFRSPVILRDMQELSYEDISKILDVPLGTVKSRINRARLQMKNTLTGN